MSKDEWRRRWVEEKARLIVHIYREEAGLPEDEHIQKLESMIRTVLSKVFLCRNEEGRCVEHVGNRG